MIQQAFAMAPSGDQTGGGAGILLPMILMFVVIYFLIILPQQRKQKQHADMISKLKKGDRVVTSGGIHGIVVGTKDNVVVLRIDDQVKIEVDRNAIASVQPSERK